jgi:succinylglutamic semialdehyde dehydrogenase
MSICGKHSLPELISIEPATGAEVWRGSACDVDYEVAVARAAWPAWAAQPLAHRVERVRSFANRVRFDFEKVADLIARETGKPLWEARNEVESVVGKVDMSVRAYADRTGQIRHEGRSGTRTAIRHKPHGVLAVLGPYNSPAHLPNAHIIPALIAGNAIIFKPSEKAPAVGALLAEYYHMAGIPEGVMRVAQGGPDTGKSLAGHSGIDGLLFTGSAHTGLALNRQFAHRPDKILTLEMGGNNPIIVWDTQDILSAVVLIVQSAFLCAGQHCTAARRLIVKQELYEPVMSELIKITDRLVVGDPHSQPPPFMGPVIDNEARDGLVESYLALMGLGGRPIRHMTTPVAGRPFLTPGIIDVTDLPERPDIELFGPLLQVIRVDTFEDAIAEANNTRFGLSASLLGGTAAQFEQFWAQSRAGVVNWNAPTTGASLAAPLGGIGLSGNHRPGAHYAADYCSYPVASAENDMPRAVIGIGLRDDETAGLVGAK